jgi:hypothetical protein
MSLSRTTWLSATIVASLIGGVVRGEDLAASVANRLRESGTLAGYRVNVKAKAGTVWLEGRVADQKQLASAVGIAESSPGVERVVNRLAIEPSAGPATAGFGLPSSTWSLVGGEAPAPQTPAGLVSQNMKPAPASGGLFSLVGGGKTPQADVQLVQSVSPASRAAVARQGARPMPIASTQGRPMRGPAPGGQVTRTAMRTNGMGEPMTLPAPGGYDGPLVDGQMVPGTMQYSEGGQVEGGYAGGPGGGAGGAPMAMGGAGVGMPPVPMRGDGPNMPNYAWPSYAASPNYAAVQYPTQYSPTAWPYIGPFYPYPQVPLGWRRVSLEWDDGWWWLDFDERHIHSHHR